jgi:hypothetical protein
MMDIGFNFIDPVPELPDGVVASDLAGLKWTSNSNIANLFKEKVKTELRKTQRGRCCFCRRVLFDDYATHLEHFVDKDSFPDYTFVIRNIALSCGTCNIKKNGYFQRWSKHTQKPSLAVTAHCSPVTNSALPPGSIYPSKATDFRWVNPYAHNYSDHIDLSRGWIFRSLTREGQRTIKWLKLNDLGEVEKRALAERMESKGGMLSMMVYAVSELSQHRAKEVGSTLAQAIKRRGRLRRRPAPF